MVTAIQQVFAHTDLIAETWSAPKGTPSGTLIEQASSGRFGVTIGNTTGTPGDTHAFGPHSVTFAAQVAASSEKATGIAAEGEDAIGVALDGTWAFPVPGATDAVVQGTPVFLVDDALSITAPTAEEGAEAPVVKRVGVVNYTASYVKTADVLPIKIGA